MITVFFVWINTERKKYICRERERININEHLHVALKILNLRVADAIVQELEDARVE